MHLSGFFGGCYDRKAERDIIGSRGPGSKSADFGDRSREGLSGLIVELLTEFVEQHEQYAVAKRKHLALLTEDIDMGTNGRANWVRESLHK
jgi:hypothetical protein